MNAPDNNPYQPPKEISARSRTPTIWPRFFMIVTVAFMGAAGGGLAEYLIYEGDPRRGRGAPTLEATIVGGGSACAVQWAIAGAIIPIEVKRIAVLIVASLATALLWIAIGGTYADVLGAATIFGWSGGAVLTAIAVRINDRKSVRLSMDEQS
jgi:hypothetical protein